MSLGAQHPLLAPEIPPVPVRRFTVDEYQRMGDARILHYEEPVELLEGWIVPKCFDWSKIPKNRPEDANPPLLPMRRFSVDEYWRLFEAGILSENDRVELIEGWIVPKMNRNPQHDGTVELIDSMLRKLVPDGWRVRVQLALLTDTSQPEPDIAIVLGAPIDGLERHPGPTDIGLVIEVADSSLHIDRTLKCWSYARSMVPCYWLVNLIDRQVEVFSSPTGPVPVPSFRQHRVIGIDDSITLVLGGIEVAEIPLRTIFPRPPRSAK